MLACGSLPPVLIPTSNRGGGGSLLKCTNLNRSPVSAPYFTSCRSLYSMVPCAEEGGVPVWWGPMYQGRMTDRHDWKHYLPATSAGGYKCSCWWTNPAVYLLSISHVIERIEKFSGCIDIIELIVVLYLQLCDCECSGDISYQAHLAGARHQKVWAKRFILPFSIVTYNRRWSTDCVNSAGGNSMFVIVQNSFKNERFHPCPSVPDNYPIRYTRSTGYPVHLLVMWPYWRRTGQKFDSSTLGLVHLKANSHLTSIFMFTVLLIIRCNSFEIFYDNMI